MVMRDVDDADNDDVTSETFLRKRERERDKMCSQSPGRWVTPANGRRLNFCPENAAAAGVRGVAAGQQPTAAAAEQRSCFQTCYNCRQPVHYPRSGCADARNVVHGNA